MVNKKQIEILNLKCVQFAKFQKSEDKFNIVFSKMIKTEY